MTPVASFQRPFDPSAARAHAARDLRHGCPRHARAPWACARGVGALRSARLVRNPRPRESVRARAARRRLRSARARRSACAMRAARCARTHSVGAWASGCASCLNLRANSSEIPSRAARRASPLSSRAQDRTLPFRDHLARRQHARLVLPRARARSSRARPRRRGDVAEPDATSGSFPLGIERRHFLQRRRVHLHGDGRSDVVEFRERSLF